jgi:DNA-binding NarL/FixJ family response regulator
MRCPATRVIMLSVFNTPEYIKRALDAGASGYVLKDLIVTDLLAAIRAVYKGKRYFSLPIADVAKQYT